MLCGSPEICSFPFLALLQLSLSYMAVLRVIQSGISGGLSSYLAIEGVPGFDPLPGRNVWAHVSLYPVPCNCRGLHRISRQWEVFCK